MLNHILLACKLYYRVYQIKKATLLAVRVHEDINKALIWMGTPSGLFFNFSPAEYILAGKGKSVIKKLREILG